MLDIYSATVVMSRAFGVYMLANVTLSVAGSFLLTARTTEPGQWLDRDVIVLAVAALAYILIALLLLIYAKAVARILTRGLGGTAVEISEANYGLLLRTALAVLGAYVLTYTIPTLAKIITVNLLARRETLSGIDDLLAARRVPVEDIVQAVAQLALGLWLIVGSKAILSLIRKAWLRIRAE
ncbi:MAG TPA: hypothetical protein VJH03_25070 [Blastocatellia bacterium]|nr:hypothetical protein [Blastocatellia bacterium]